MPAGYNREEIGSATTMNKKTLFTLPIASTTFEGGGAFLCRGAILFEYFRDGSLRKSGIQFENISALRERAEPSCTAWHVEGSYDTLVEIEESPWLAEIISDIPEVLRPKWGLRHYMIYIDSSGCFEFIAKSWKALEEESGSWMPL
ncbi:MAG TPA: hypothetical protein VIM02_00605 [Rhizomicrobium sp.]|jgi:hypothetical protein